MPTGRPADYVLFHPTKRAANKAIAVEKAAEFFKGKVLDKSTVETPDWGICHVAAYTDRIGAMVGNAKGDIKFGDVDWHEKGRIIMVRELPRSGNTPARITFYVCEIEALFAVKNVGASGIKWSDVGASKLFSQRMYSSDLTLDD